MSKSCVAIVMGSDSDLPVMNACFDILPSLLVSPGASIVPVDCAPEVTGDWVRAAAQPGCGVSSAAVETAARRADPGFGQLVREEWAANVPAIYSRKAALQASLQG